MEARILLNNAIFSIICIFLSPFAVNSQRETPPGGTIPIVNPTTPGGTIPIVNPTSPNPPFTTGPPATTGPPPATGSGGGGGGGGSWCVASSSASETALQVALDYACGYGGADCSPLQPNGPCYEPNTVRDHASYAFNDYYQKNPAPTSCHGNCRYASSSSGTQISPPRSMPPPAIPMTPPSITTPVNPYPPVGNGYGSEPGYDYGSEPTGTPNSAGIISLDIFKLVILNCLLLMSVSMANHF
ncbi:Carbohydrate-binding X8 domain superfamily protein [Striga hermonthica]|uniref:Carbohydrate-binding X8 domain superfamily protein n=1 Tax=Striga hermonthica TaxID=68872 RepID=A0A9N7N047_STRHE|nr:Carbohydrate-binding X8 domain superfamily protein [Striga hermonthica]